MYKATSGSSSLEGTSRKRKRTVDGQATERNMGAGVSEPLTRDPSYYMDSGDCIIRVQNTLFKVHKAFLSRDSSAFEGMFSLPQNPDENFEGNSDQHPITLFDDTAEQFRGLMWILYALPQQIETLLLEKVSRLSQLITIAEVANKYHFVELGVWAMKTLKAVFEQTTVSPMHHERILRMAIVSNDQQLCDAFVSNLSAKLMDGSLAPTETLIIADRLHIRELQGVAYYAQLMALQKDNSDPTAFPPSCPLSKNQRIRLLTGYWSLTRRWEHLRDTPVVVEQSPSCPPHLHANCQHAWDTQWRLHACAQSVTQRASADVLGRTQAMHNLLLTSFPQPSYTTLPSPPQQTIAGINVPNQNPTIQNFQALQNMLQHNASVFQNHPQQTIAGINVPSANNHSPLAMLVMPRRNCNSVALCTQRALAATKKLSDEIRASLLDFFSEDALGLIQGSS